MTHATAVRVMVVLCFAAVPAAAQPAPRAAGFINVNAAIQEGPQRLSLAVPVEVFGSSGTLNVDDGGVGGGLFDVSGGVRGRGFAFGVGYSRTSTETSFDFTAATNAASPGSFTRSVNGITPALEHSERTVYVFAAFTRRVSRRFDFMLSGGPSFIAVRQGVPAGVTLDARGSEVVHVDTAAVDDSAIGFHAALDFNYLFHKRIGVGALARYTWGSIALPDSTDDMTLGGLQVGAGLRLRF
jgi:hypothetical protein